MEVRSPSKIFKPTISGKVMVELKRALGLFEATMLGIGLILGAGIYVVIGRTAEHAMNAIWASILIAGAIAFLTGLSYAELSSLFPRASSSYFYVKKGLRREILAFLVGWLIFFEAACGASTASVGFSSYFLSLLGIKSKAWLLIVSLSLIALLSFLNYLGIEESAKLAILFTFFEALGLILIIALGFLFGSQPNYFQFPDFFSLMNGAALIFFAYVGFELMAATSEETKEARKTMPKAIILALLITGVLYLLVGLSVVRLLPWQNLAKSHAPLADAASKVLGQFGWFLIAFIALFATSNTVLGFLVTSSRISYGMAKDGMIWGALGKVGKRRTPTNAILLAALVASFQVLLAGLSKETYAVIDVVAKASNLGALVAFIFVNLSLVALRRNGVRGGFSIPFSLFGFPLLPLIASLLCITTIFISFHEFSVWIGLLSIMVLGLIFRRLL